MPERNVTREIADLVSGWPPVTRQQLTDVLDDFLRPEFPQECIPTDVLIRAIVTALAHLTLTEGLRALTIKYRVSSAIHVQDLLDEIEALLAASPAPAPKAEKNV